MAQRRILSTLLAVVLGVLFLSACARQVKAQAIPPPPRPAATHESGNGGHRLSRRRHRVASIGKRTKTASSASPGAVRKSYQMVHRQTILVRPVPKTATVTLRIEATGQADKIWIGDRECGSSPQTINLPPGQYHVTVKSDGYPNIERDVDLETGSSRPYVIDERFLEPPTALSASASGNDFVLSWAASSEATSYVVKSSSSPAGPFIDVASSLPDTRYQLAGNSENGTYYYEVTAVNPTGESSPCAAVPINFAPPDAAVQVKYTYPSEFNVTECTWYVDDQVALSGYSGVLKVQPGHHTIGFKSVGEGYHWKDRNGFGMTLRSGTIGQNVSARFQIDVTPSGSVISANSWISSKGLKGSVFSYERAELDVTVDGVKVNTDEW